MIAFTKINMFMATIMVLCTLATAGQTNALEISLKSRMLTGSKPKKAAAAKDDDDEAGTNKAADAKDDSAASKTNTATKEKDEKAAGLRGKANKAAKDAKSKFKKLEESLKEKAETKTVTLEITAEEHKMIDQMKVLRDPKKKMMFMIVGVFLFFLLVLGMRSFMGTICSIFG